MESTTKAPSTRPKPGLTALPAPCAPKGWVTIYDGNLKEWVFSNVVTGERRLHRPPLEARPSISAPPASGTSAGDTTPTTSSFSGGGASEGLASPLGVYGLGITSSETGTGLNEQPPPSSSAQAQASQSVLYGPDYSRYAQYPQVAFPEQGQRQSREGNYQQQQQLLQLQMYQFQLQQLRQFHDQQPQQPQQQVSSLQAGPTYLPQQYHDGRNGVSTSVGIPNESSGYMHSQYPQTDPFSYPQPHQQQQQQGGLTFPLSSSQMTYSGWQVPSSLQQCSNHDYDVNSINSNSNATYGNALVPTPTVGNGQGDNAMTMMDSYATNGNDEYYAPAPAVAVAVPAAEPVVSPYGLSRFVPVSVPDSAPGGNASNGQFQ